MGAKQAKIAKKLDKKSVEKLQYLIKGELSEDEIQCCYKTYQECRKSNKSNLTRDEFKKVYSGIFKADSTESGAEFAEHVFRTFDINNDGHVDFQEFLLGLCLAGSKDAETKITWAFKVYDINGDGSISWSEMRNIIQVYILVILVIQLARVCINGTEMSLYFPVLALLFLLCNC